MRIEKSRPPNFSSILKVFPQAAGRGVIFAYGDIIYAPFADVTPELYAHECVHGARQLAIGGPEHWWERYLDDMAFRYNEELLAHRAEYQKIMEMTPTRQVRRSALKVIAKKLAAPLYGGMVTLHQAEKDLAA